MIAGGIMLLRKLRIMLMPNKLLNFSHLLQQAKEELSCCNSFAEMRSLFVNLVKQNETWRANQCINLVAAEGPMSDAARRLLASDLSMRTAGGHIGEANRYFVATKYIDRFESICHVILKKLYACHFCDHRLLGGTQACHSVYATLTKPGDTIIAVSPHAGGDSSG